MSNDYQKISRNAVKKRTDGYRMSGHLSTDAHPPENRTIITAIANKVIKISKISSTLVIARFCNYFIFYETYVHNNTYIYITYVQTLFKKYFE